MVAAAIVGSAVVTGVASSQASKNAAKSAAGAQQDSTYASIEEQRRQFDAMRELLNPFVNAGQQALGGQQDLLGLNGADAQQAAIDNIANSSAFKTYQQQGENAILQNASATGGLRGGNTQAALSQFSPQLLNQMVNQQYSNLGGLTALGQNAAAGVGNAGMQSANSISGLLQNLGASQAGNALAQGQANANMWNGVNSAIGSLGGMYLYKNGF